MDAYDFVVDAEDVVEVAFVDVLLEVADPEGVALAVRVDAGGLLVVLSRLPGIVHSGVFIKLRVGFKNFNYLVLEILC